MIIFEPFAFLTMIVEVGLRESLPPLHCKAAATFFRIATSVAPAVAGSPSSCLS